MKKKMISIMLSGVLAASALTGCGSETSESGVVSTGGVESTEQVQETEKAMEKVNVTIGAMREDIYAEFSEMTVINELEAAAADYLEIDWTEWQAESSAEKISLAINGGQYPDALMGTWTLTAEQTSNYAGQGILVPLEDYITEELTPNLHAIFEARPEYKEALTATDGHIYALASYCESTDQLRTINDTILINTEWLEAVGKEMPTTTEELYEVLVAFRDAGDLNGNGVDDEIPMSFCYGSNPYGSHQYGTHSIIGWFGVCNNANGITQRENGEIVYTGVQPEYKEAVKYLNRLYSEDLLDKEVFTMADSVYSAKCKSETPMVGVMVWWSDYAINSAAGEGTYAYLPPLTSPTGLKPSWQYRNNPLTGYLSFWVTDKGQDKLPQLMKFVDQFYDQDLGVELKFGLEGKYIEEVSENVFIELKDAEGNAFAEEEKSKDVPLKSSPFLILRENFSWETQTAGNLSGLAAMEVYKDYVEPAHTYLNTWLTSEESEEYGILSIDIGEHFRQNFAKWVVEGGIDEEWDAYVKAFEGLGLEKMMDIKLID